MDTSTGLVLCAATISLRKGAREKNHNFLLRRGKRVSGGKKKTDMPYALEGANGRRATLSQSGGPAGRPIVPLTHVVAANAASGWRAGLSSGRGTKVRFQREGRAVAKGYSQAKG
jgi:hypothetical protein